MRYEKTDNILKLAFRMQASAEGLTLADMQETLGGVSRRTAERARDAILRVFPQTEEIQDPDGRFKRWRIPSGALRSLTGISRDELGCMATAALLCERENLPQLAEQIGQLMEKLKGMLKPGRLLHMEPDLEAQMEAEGFAMRPGPRIRLNGKVLEELRFAIIACRKVCITYQSPSRKSPSKSVVMPYGFLFGNRHYMVAEKEGSPEMRLYVLGRIHKVEVLDEGFCHRAGFDLKAFASRAFGVFQEDPFEVEWKFAPAAASAAREYVFHPTQTTEECPDGSLIVRFTAGGALEMSWHLHTWGDAVKVLKPADFWDRVAERAKGFYADDKK